MSLIAELSALSTALDELTTRVVRLADTSAGEGGGTIDGVEAEEIRGDLHEVERHLTQAGRRVAKSLRSLSGG